MTASEWVNVLLADTAMVAAGVLVAWLLWSRGRTKLGATLAAATWMPPVVGLWFLKGELGEDKNGCLFLCYTPYQSHWVGWTVGGAVSVMIVVGAGVVILVGAIGRRTRANAG